MSNLKVQQNDGPGGPPFELDLNILTIRAQGEAQFMDGFEEHFWALMHSEFDEVTVDLARSDGMADDAFRMIALNMFEIGNRSKAITIRIPESLERFFKHANLYRVADIEVVRLLGKKRSADSDANGGESADDSASGEQGAAVASRSESAVELPVEPMATNARPERPTDTQMLKVELQQRYAQQLAAKQAAAEAATSAGSDAGEADAEAVPGDMRRGKGRLVDRRTGQVVDLTKSPTNIGRVPGNDILIAMPLVSKRHARITLEDHVYYIEDLGSSNGTYVNAARLAGKTALTDGARIQVAITSQYPNGAKEYTFRQDVE